MVACSPAVTQRDASLFSNPNTWEPTRWLAEPNVYATYFQMGSFVQFGLGQHACPGEKLAKILIFDEILGTWVKGYEVDVISELDGSLSKVKDGYWPGPISPVRCRLDYAQAIIAIKISLS